MRKWILISCLLFMSPPVLADEWKPLTTLAPVDRVNVGVIRLTSEVPIPPAVRDASRSVCRVRVSGKDGSQYMGSGTYIGQRTVVTAKHVVAEGILSTAVVEFGSSRITSRGYLANQYADQYLIQITSDPPVKPIPIATTAPTSGEVVYVMGFGHNVFDIWPARLSGFGSAVSQQDSGFYSGRRARSGDSGGAIINARGEYVGTIWGGGGNDAVAVTYTQTTSFFRRSGLLGRLFGRKGTQVQTQTQATFTGGCYGGQCPTQQPRQQPQASQDYAPSPDYFDTNEPQQPTTGTCDGCKCTPGERGPAGPQGEPGPAGPPGSITEAQISAIVATLKEQLIADGSLRGPQGPAGRPGQVTQEQIDQLAASITIPPQRVVLVDGSSGEVIDDETYQPGEAIVLDFQRIINAAEQR